MPDEVKTQRDDEADNDGGWKDIPYFRNAPVESHHGTDGENEARDIGADRDFRHVNFRAGSLAFHALPLT